MNQDVHRRILVVDDTRSIHQDFRKILSPPAAAPSLDSLEASLFGDSPPGVEPARYEIGSAYSGEEGAEKVKAALDAGERYAVAFVDMRMPPGWDGVETIERLWALDPDLQVVICTAYSDYSWDELLTKFGYDDRLLILKKPFDNAEVSQLACALTEKWRLEREAHLERDELDRRVAEQTSDLLEANTRLLKEVAERRRAENALRQSEDRYAIAAAGANDGLWDWDLVRGQLYLSNRWWAMVGHPEDRTGTATDWFGRVLPTDRPALEREFGPGAPGPTHFAREFRAQHTDGQPRWFLCRGVVVRDDAGAASRAAGSLTDITDAKQVEAQLRHDAVHDALTGLANRALLTQRLDACLRQASADPTFHYAVLFLDLDRFKNVNDSLGHVAGDELLVAIAHRIADSVRPGDLVARDPLLARVGGDEFVVLLDGISRTTDAMPVAERLLTVLSGPFEVAGHQLFTSASVGIATSDGRYLRWEDVLRDADTALYRAKSSGRGRLEVFDPSMHANAVSRWRMENDLRSAVERGELRLQFQPIVHASRLEVIEFEALVRWERPGLGRVPPDQFIPLAEETGLILPIGEWVLRQACRQLRSWRLGNPALARCKMAVNVSGRQFADPGFPVLVRSILDETGVTPSQLKFEITESALMGVDSTTDAVLASIREMGISLHLDDFGTGFASLSYLHRFRVDGLKIDRSFVGNMDSDQMSSSIVKTIVGLARMLDLEVVAEGVESTSQLDRLRAAGCDRAQGYLFSRPLDPEGIPNLFLALGRK